MSSQNKSTSATPSCRNTAYKPGSDLLALSGCLDSRYYSGMPAKPQSWDMEPLMKFFRQSAEKFGNPQVIELERPAVFDLRWDVNPPLTLRWTWDDPYAVRKEALSREGSLIGAALTGLREDYLSHVELEQPNNSWLYVSYRLVDYPGKVNANTIVRCLTQEGEWMKQHWRPENIIWRSGVKMVHPVG